MQALASSHKNLKVAPLDISLEESIQNLASEFPFSEIGLIINNAGVSDSKGFGGWSQSHLLEAFKINTVGPALLVQALSPFLKKGSKLILMSSGRASLDLNQSAKDDLDVYGLSESALNMLTRRLSVKFAKRGIPVVSLSPGWVQTDMGGPEAPNKVSEVIPLLTSIIDNVSLKDSGSFLDELGEEIPW